MSTTIAPGAAAGPGAAPARVQAAVASASRAGRARGSVPRPDNHVIVVFGATGDLAHCKLIVLPAVNPGHIPPTDFGHAGQLITWALAAARTALAAEAPNPPPAGLAPARLWLAGPDVEARPHD